MLDAVLSCEGMASEAVLNAAMDVARKRRRRRRASLYGLSFLVAALPLSWLCPRHLSDDFSRHQPPGPAVVQSPSAGIVVKTESGPSGIRLVTARGRDGGEEAETAWRVRTRDLPPAQRIVKISDDDLLLLAGRKQKGSGAALVYASEGMRFLVAESAAPEPFR